MNTGHTSGGKSNYLKDAFPVSFHLHRPCQLQQGSCKLSHIFDSFGRQVNPKDPIFDGVPCITKDTPVYLEDILAVGK